MHYFYQKLTDKNITNKELLDLLKEVRTTLNLKEDELIVEEKLVTASYYRVLGNIVLIVTSNEVAATICTILSIFFFTLFEIILISNLGDN